MDKAENGENQNNKPLTLSDLAKYNSEVLLPAIDKRFDVIDKRFKGVETKFEGVATKEELGEVKEQVQELNKKVTDSTDKVLSALDENTALLRDKRQEQEATSATLVGHGKAIGGHEQRITKLESKAVV